jgi:hypothetical protein
MAVPTQQMDKAAPLASSRNGEINTSDEVDVNSNPSMVVPTQQMDEAAPHQPDNDALTSIGSALTIMETPHNFFCRAPVPKAPDKIYPKAPTTSPSTTQAC